MTRASKPEAAEPLETADQLLALVDLARSDLIELTQRLVRIQSETPPSDTREMARTVAQEFSGDTAISCGFYPSQHPIENLVAVIRSDRPGKRLVFNGHLDTYPAGDSNAWSEDPFSGSIRNGRIYGRGSVDMKAGIACALVAFKILSRNRHLWSGELVLALAGDEESMGTLGSQHLLDTVEQARGDAMLCADVGSPRVPRIGEKGMIWIDVSATGRAAHGAHVHRGQNAIDALRVAMDALSELRDWPVETPKEVASVISDAKEVSEPLGGKGEADILRKVTVNFGHIQGGSSANLVADQAILNADIRLPMGVTVGQVESRIEELLGDIDNITFEIVRRYEPSWTSPEDPIVHAVSTACHRVLEEAPVVNMRVGASDARLYRAAGIPTVVCGLTPHNLGAPDEFVDIDEMVAVTKIHVLSALEFLG